MANLPRHDGADKTESFPALSPVSTQVNTSSNNTFEPATNQPESSTTTVLPTQRRTRGASLLESFMNSAPPLGFLQAAGEVTSKVPTLPEIRSGAFGDDGWTQEGQLEHRGYDPHRAMDRVTETRRRSGSIRRSSDRTRTGSIRQSLDTKRESSAGVKASTDLRNANHAVAEEHDPTEVAPSIVRPEREDLHIQHQGATQDPSHESTSSTADTHALQNSLASVAVSPHATRPHNIENPTEAAMTHTNSTGPDDTGTYPNGYRFPAKHSWAQSLAIFAKAFWGFFITPMGFLITIYALNVVGWGAMIFFTLIPPAVPALCHPGGCNGLYSKRRIWVEIDAQVLNALFCVTGFGLLPWRLRDFYYLMKWRIGKNVDAHRKLAGIYRGWYRLPGSNNLPNDLVPPPADMNLSKDTGMVLDIEMDLSYGADDKISLNTNPAVPLPVSCLPSPPLTGVRAPPTKSWNLDGIIWLYILNSAFQVVLATYMWSMNRFTRPAWATGLFVTLGCLTGIFAGIIVFKEGKKVKRVEGVPVEEYDVVESVEEYQARKHKEDKKSAKKESRHSHHHDHGRRKTIIQRGRREEVVVVGQQKFKGRDWFVRH